MNDFRPYPVGTRVMVKNAGYAALNGLTGVIVEELRHRRGFFEDGKPCSMFAYGVDLHNSPCQGLFLGEHHHLIPLTDPDADVTLDADPVTLGEPQGQPA